MNNAVDKLMTGEALEMMAGEKKISFEELSNKKTVLFVTTNPVNKTMQKLTNMFFTDAFRLLFEYAESLPGKELPLPVHLICDDFATGCKIPDFYEYLSVFCAKAKPQRSSTTVIHMCILAEWMMKPAVISPKEETFPSKMCTLCRLNR